MPGKGMHSHFSYHLGTSPTLPTTFSVLHTGRTFHIRAHGILTALNTFIPESQVKHPPPPHSTKLRTRPSPLQA
ncbi:hypothetical protein BDR04DRAFT_827283 [Suillus decipiens]|nr:hypothetical protein BDR04DRAFT_827283 [Suillus decipiens]